MSVYKMLQCSISNAYFNVLFPAADLLVYNYNIIFYIIYIWDAQ